MKQRIGWTMGALLLSLMVGFSGADEMRNQVIVIDIPGIETQGEQRPTQWGPVLIGSTDFARHNIRHEGAWGFNLQKPEPGVTTTLPHERNAQHDASFLAPVLADIKAGKSTYIKIDQNIKAEAYLTTGKPAEGEWVRSVGDWLTAQVKQINPNAEVIVNAHSKGTLDTHQLNLARVDRVLLASDRGAVSDALPLAGRYQSTYFTLITGDRDIPHGLEGFMKAEAPNVAVINLKSGGLLPTTVHGQVTDPTVRGSFDIKTAGGVQRWEGTLGDIVQQVSLGRFVGHRPAGAASIPAGDGSRPTPQWSEKDLLRTGRALASGTTLTKPLQSTSSPIDPGALADRAVKTAAKTVLKQEVSLAGYGSAVKLYGVVDTGLKMWNAWRVGTGRAEPEVLKSTIPHVVQAWDALKGAPNLPTQTFTIQSTSVYNDGARQIQTQSTQTIRQNFSSTAPGTIGHYGFDPQTDSYTRQTTTQTIQRETVSGSSFNSPSQSSSSSFNSPSQSSSSFNSPSQSSSSFNSPSRSSSSSFNSPMRSSSSSFNSPMRSSSSSFNSPMRSSSSSFNSPMRSSSSSFNSPSRSSSSSFNSPMRSSGR